MTTNEQKAHQRQNEQKPSGTSPERAENSQEESPEIRKDLRKPRPSLRPEPETPRSGRRRREASTRPKGRMGGLAAPRMALERQRRPQGASEQERTEQPPTGGQKAPESARDGLTASEVRSLEAPATTHRHRSRIRGLRPRRGLREGPSRLGFIHRLTLNRLHRTSNQKDR